MKKPIAFVLLTVLLAAGTAFAIHETVPSETQVPMPGPNAERLYDYITKARPYTAWNLWPGKGRLYKGTEPHGALLTTYVNERAYDAAKKKTAMSEAAIIVKENYTPEKSLAALTVMYKVKGFNPAAGDWFWAKYDTAGKVQASGKVEGCINCHGKKKDNDFIYTGKVGK